MLMPNASRTLIFTALLFTVVATACGGNAYGYSPEYQNLSEEASYAERATELSYEEVRRDPEGHRDSLLGWFGIVTSLKREPEGRVRLGLSLRFHQPRHLCSGPTDDTCRVTVSERSGGPFTTVVEIHADDVEGPARLNVGSLVRVYGHVNGDLDDEGGPVIIGDYYRHWPHGAYVTTASQRSMRR